MLCSNMLQLPPGGTTTSRDSQMPHSIIHGRSWLCGLLRWEMGKSRAFSYIFLGAYAIVTTPISLKG